MMWGKVSLLTKADNTWYFSFEKEKHLVSSPLSNEDGKGGGGGTFGIHLILLLIKAF